MAAANTDHFKKAKRKFSTTIAAGGFAQAATSLPLTTTTGLDTDTAITLVIAPGESAEEVITGVVSGSNVTNCVRGKEGTTDQDHSAGDAVTMYFTETHWDDAMTGILVQHKQDGTHANTITTDTINENTSANGVTIDGLNIKDGALNTNNSVPGKALATSAILLGYTQITSNFTTTSMTAVQVTGLTSTVTVPAGGRSVKITAYAYRVSNSGLADGEVSIWDGTVASGTRLNTSQAYSAAAGQGFATTVMAVVTPSAGSKTYNVGMLVTGNTGTLHAASTAPAFILVELI